jgi:hypothetical protein
MQLAMSAQQTILNSTVLNLGGDLALSSVGIMRASGAYYYADYWFQQGAQPLIGYNYGARDMAGKGDFAKSVIAQPAMHLSYFSSYFYGRSRSSGCSAREHKSHFTYHPCAEIFFTLIPLADFRYYARVISGCWEIHENP